MDLKRGWARPMMTPQDFITFMETIFLPPKAWLTLFFPAQLLSKNSWAAGT